MKAIELEKNYKPEEFEDMIKRNIATRKLEQLILSSAKVTNQELVAHSYLFCHFVSIGILAKKHTPPVPYTLVNSCSNNF